jgi:hypothetical protein
LDFVHRKAHEMKGCVEPQHSILRWPPGAGGAPKINSRGRLLRVQDGVFASLGDAEFYHALGRNLDGFAGSRVAAHARGTIDEDELAQAWERKGILRVPVGELRNLFENLDRLFLRKAGLLGDGSCDLRFGECFSHSVFLFFQFFNLS